MVTTPTGPCGVPARDLAEEVSNLERDPAPIPAHLTTEKIALILVRLLRL